MNGSLASENVGMKDLKVRQRLRLSAPLRICKDVHKRAANQHKAASGKLVGLLIVLG